MKIRENYLLSEIEGEYIVITVGNVESSFNGYLKLNETSKFLWDLLKENITLETLVDQLMTKYSINIEIAKKDVEDFLNMLREVKALEE